MKETVLTKIHEELGAKMVPFAGYKMPVQYKGLKHEHLLVREKLGVFDVSHMGEFFVKGEEAEKFLQYVTSNDITKLSPGKAQYCYLPNESGGIVDDLIVYQLAEGEYMLVVNAANLEKDFNWLKKHNSTSAQLIDSSEEWGLLAIQGPFATKAMQSLTDEPLSEMKMFTFKKGVFAGEKDIIISATGYTGSGGLEIYVPNISIENVWKKVLEAGKEYGIEPIGLGARDTLRLEAGLCLYGNDIDETTSPIAARLGWTTKTDTKFINWEAIQEEKENGVAEKLIGFELLERGIPRQGYSILNAEGEKIGRVTSGTMSPSLNKAIGMGYVPKELAKVDSEIYIEIRKKSIPAKVVKLPFYKA